MNATLAGQAEERTVEPAAAVLARHGRSFHFASHLLGARHGRRAAQLYAFCRRVDDMVDEASDAATAAVALAELEQALVSGIGGPAWLAEFRALQAETGLGNGPALALIEGVRGDLGSVALADEDELIRYGYRVAGTVGLMMCAVLDVRDPRAYPFAIDLGIGMQLTNIARDVGTDARMDRRYLPATWVGAATPAQIADPDPTLQRTLQVATARVLELADRFYASGAAGMGFLPARARLAILTAAHVYRGIGERIRRNDCRSWDMRAVVDGTGKLGLAAEALLGFMIRPGLHRRTAVHDASLHAPLRRLLREHGDG